MWVVVIFDLPMTSANARREYVWFRKMLLRQGFDAVQKSVYLCWLDSAAAAKICCQKVTSEFPGTGKLAVFRLTKDHMNTSFFVQNGRLDKSPEKPEPFLLF